MLKQKIIMEEDSKKGMSYFTHILIERFSREWGLKMVNDITDQFGSKEV